MGQKIGDYVHYHYSNYLAFGLARSRQGITNNANNYNTYAHQEGLYNHISVLKKQLRNSLSREAEQKKIQIIQNKIDKYYSSFKNSKEILSTADLNDMQNAIYQYMAQKVNGLQPSDIDWETFTIRPEALKKVDINKINITDSRILSATTLMKSGVGKGSKFYARSFHNHIIMLKELLKQASNLSNYNQLLSKLNQIEQATKNWKGQMSISALQTSGKKTYVEELQDIAKILLKVSMLEQLEGDLSEAVSRAMQISISEVGTDAVNKILKILEEDVIGNDASHNIYVQKNFTPSIKLDKVFENTKGLSKQGKDWKVNIATKGKIDIQFNIDDTAFNGSVKSYNLGLAGLINNRTQREYEMSLVSKTPLLYLIQNDGYFVNHYLNQTVDTIESRYRNVIQQANKAMRELILLRSLAGGNLQVNKNSAMANILIINDKSGKGKMKAISIATLLERLIERHQLDSGLYIQGFDLNRTWANEWASSPQVRITKLLNQLYKTKITTALKLSTIKNIVF